MRHAAGRSSPQRTCFHILPHSSSQDGSCWQDGKPGFGKISLPGRALLDQIHASSKDSGPANIGGADGADVTGGMASKVRQMLELVSSVNWLEVTIFSGRKPGDLLKALRREPIGTQIIL